MRTKCSPCSIQMSTNVKFSENYPIKILTTGVCGSISSNTCSLEKVHCWVVFVFLLSHWWWICLQMNLCTKQWCSPPISICTRFINTTRLFIYLFILDDSNHTQLIFLGSVLYTTSTTSSDPVNKTSMSCLKVIADCWSLPVCTHTHNLNMARSHSTFPSTGMKMVSMTSWGSGRSSQFLLKHPVVWQE